MPTRHHLGRRHSRVLSEQRSSPAQARPSTCDPLRPVFEQKRPGERQQAADQAREHCFESAPLPKALNEKDESNASTESASRVYPLAINSRAMSFSTDNHAMLRFLACAFLALPLALNAAPRTCLIVGVSDGDTLKARCGTPGNYEEIKVRLNGIDAPEKHQAFGGRAKQAMSDLVYMKEAELDCFKLDRYGRSVCRIAVAPRSAPNAAKTLDPGLAMVAAGMAWWYRAYAKEQSPQERSQYESAESTARTKRVGLWSDPDPIAPWEWRKVQRNR